MTNDYSGQNLRGRSFKGQNLEGADFSRADIRGANFTGANLIGANFSKAKAGLQKQSCMLLVGVSCLLAGISGFFSSLNSFILIVMFDPGRQEVGWVSLIIVIALIAIIIRQGINATAVFPVAFTVAFAVVAAAFDTDISAISAGISVNGGEPLLVFGIAGAVSFVGAFGFAVAFAVAGGFGFAGAFVVAVVFAIAEAIAGYGTGAGSVVFFYQVYT